jgi:hypothetical protein
MVELENLARLRLRRLYQQDLEMVDHLLLVELAQANPLVEVQVELELQIQVVVAAAAELPQLEPVAVVADQARPVEF